jgi:hypothetical protein
VVIVTPLEPGSSPCSKTLPQLVLRRSRPNPLTSAPVSADGLLRTAPSMAGIAAWR